MSILSLDFLLDCCSPVRDAMKNLRESVDAEFNGRQDYLSLRSLSVRINDHLKWMCIRKNIILGFSDRLPFDCKTYFTIDSEDR